MKIAYISDLHLEFHITKIEPEDVDVLILAGDICSVSSSYEFLWNMFLDEMAEKIKKIFIVMGNHEFYGSSLESGKSQLEHIIKKYNNVVLLDDSVEHYQGVGFYGATLWTNFYNENIIEVLYAKKFMNDFYAISNNTTDKIINKNKETLDWLYNIELVSNKNIMISHHLPHRKCISERFKNNPVNGSFVCDVPEDIINKFDFWIHGHSHDSLEIYINRTKVIRNPVGYPSESKNFAGLKYIEI
jgi:Icc-related predicted phosphoesterase